MISKKRQHVKALKATLFLFFFMAFYQAVAQNEAAGSKTGMLILGSDDIKTLKERVNIGYALYRSGISFDYIIVSGGCAAHRSNICEATQMAALLKGKGVPPVKIFKEEKSKTTVQNYCYSRILTGEDGTRLIHPGDTLYVVSNHWHAIPVAARFTAYDSVKAFYHIEGSILPSVSDKVDYSNIYDNNLNSDDYCTSALWPLVNASLSLQHNGTGKGKKITYHFVDDLVYPLASGNSGTLSPQLISEKFPKIPAGWQEGIDAAFYNKPENKVYFFEGPFVLRFTPDAKTIDAGYPRLIRLWLKGLPAGWRDGAIDAAFFDPAEEEICLFRGDEYLKFSSRTGKIKNGVPRKIKSFITNWPFSWGSGGIDAAYFIKEEKKTIPLQGKGTSKNFFGRQTKS